MAPSVQIVLSSCLSFGVPMLFAARELFVMRRGGGFWRPHGPEPTPPPDPRNRPDGVCPSFRPLPECLIPVRVSGIHPPDRARVPELV